MEEVNKTITNDTELNIISKIDDIIWLKFKFRNNDKIFITLRQYGAKYRLTIMLYKNLSNILQDMSNMLSNKRIGSILINRTLENDDLTSLATLNIDAIIINKWCTINIPIFKTITHVILDDSTKLQYNNKCKGVINLNHLPALETITWCDKRNLGYLPDDGFFSRYKIRLLLSDFHTSFTICVGLSTIKYIHDIEIFVYDFINYGSFQYHLIKYFQRENNIKKLYLEFNDHNYSKIGTIYDELYNAIDKNTFLEKATMCIESVYINDVLRFNEQNSKISFADINIIDISKCYDTLLTYDYDTLNKLFGEFIKKALLYKKSINDDRMIIILNNIIKYTTTLQQRLYIK